MLFFVYFFPALFYEYESILATRNMDSTAVGIPTLQFDPDRYPHATLKAFNDFIEQFEFRYTQNLQKVSYSFCCKLYKVVIESILVPSIVLANITFPP